MEGKGVENEKGLRVEKERVKNEKGQKKRKRGK